MRLDYVETKLEPRDLWIGLFWDHYLSDKQQGITLYICLVPVIVHVFVISSRVEIKRKKGIRTGNGNEKVIGLHHLK